MPNVTINDALEDAYENAPDNIAIVDTIELNHPDFSQPIRLVNNSANINGRISETEVVEFIACFFEFKMAPRNDKSVPEASVTISNVSLNILKILDTLTVGQPIKLTYRPFLSDDYNIMQIANPFQFSLEKVVVTEQTITASLKVQGIATESFPARVYSQEDFPFLAF